MTRPDKHEGDPEERTPAAVAWLVAIYGIALVVALVVVAWQEFAR